MWKSQLIKSILQNSKEAPELEALGTTETEEGVAED
jgi:hypothetical protein